MASSTFQGLIEGNLAAFSEPLPTVTLSEVAEVDEPGDLDEWWIVPPLKGDHPLAEDPINYWLQEQSNFPQLSQLALDYTGFEH